MRSLDMAWRVLHDTFVVNFQVPASKAESATRMANRDKGLVLIRQHSDP